ncbi:MAG TPA: DNA topoisomerase IV [Flavobacterium lutivivi]|nr:DNA topoisomerase IV [Flavobacterium lutivivi]
MKKITLLLLYIITLSCYQQERKCTDFKTGKFEFSQEIDGKKQTSIFTRTNDLQIETYNGKTDTASVRWVNDCEFILQKLHPKNMTEKKAISMKILFTKNNTYTFEYGFVGDEKKQRGTVTKLD